MKTERLLAIVIVLLDKRQVSASQLAELFEVSIRTIYRDIHSLSEAGIPVTSLPGVNGGIKIMDHYKLDKQFFTASDITALLIAMENLGSNISSSQSKQTMEKLKTLIPTHLSEEISFKANQIAIDLTPWTNSQTIELYVEIIKNSMDHQCLLSFDYIDRKGMPSKRIVEPYRLLLKEISWYLQAYCVEKKEFRTFKLSRITNIENLKQSFKQRKFDPHILKKAAFSDSPFITITLKVTRKAKEQLTDKFGPLKTFKTENSEIELLEFPFMADDFGYNLIIGLGNQCECIKPEFVRTELKRRLKEILMIYKD